MWETMCVWRAAGHSAKTSASSWQRLSARPSNSKLATVAGWNHLTAASTQRRSLDCSCSISFLSTNVESKAAALQEDQALRPSEWVVCGSSRLLSALVAQAVGSSGYVAIIESKQLELVRGLAIA